MIIKNCVHTDKNMESRKGDRSSGDNGTYNIEVTNCYKDLDEALIGSSENHQAFDIKVFILFSI